MLALYEYYLVGLDRFNYPALNFITCPYIYGFCPWPDCRDDRGILVFGAKYADKQQPRKIGGTVCNGRFRFNFRRPASR